MAARALGEPVADRLGFVGVVVRAQMDREIDRRIGLDLIEELSKLGPTMLWIERRSGRSRNADRHHKPWIAVAL